MAGRSKSYLQFRVRLTEIRSLIEIAENFSSGSFQDAQRQVYLARSAIVLLGGHLEGYLSALGEEIVQSSAQQWQALPVALQRHITICNFRSLHRYAEKNARENFSSPSKVAGFWQKVTQSITVYGSPSQFRTGGVKAFYNIGLPAVDDYLSDFGDGVLRFGKFMDAKGIDLSLLETGLQGILNYRNDIAHGTLTATPGVSDARSAVQTVVTIVRNSDEYVRQYHTL